MAVNIKLVFKVIQTEFVLTTKNDGWFFEDGELAFDVKRLDGQCHYVTELSSTINIRQKEQKKMYNTLMGFYTTVQGKCKPFKVELYIKCKKEWQCFFKGEFTLFANAGHIHDIYGKRFEIAPKRDDIWQCLQNYKNHEVNWFDLPLHRFYTGETLIEGNPFETLLEFSYGFLGYNLNLDIPQMVDGSGNPLPNNPNEFLIFPNTIVTNDGSSPNIAFQNNFNTNHLKPCEGINITTGNIIVGPQNSLAGLNSDAIGFIDQCPKYWWIREEAKPVNFGNSPDVQLRADAWYRECLLESQLAGFVPDPNEGWEYIAEEQKYVRCPISECKFADELGGRLLQEILSTYLLGLPCAEGNYNCVRSDFFGYTTDEINHPNIELSPNFFPAYEYAKKYLRNILVKEISNVRDYFTAAESAHRKRYVFDFEKFEEIMAMFNLCYWVEDGCFRIEHKSYFWLHTNNNYIKLSDYSDCYKDEEQKTQIEAGVIPAYEEFEYGIITPSPAFKPRRITYDELCANSNNKSELSIECFTPDFACIIGNEDVEIGGFVLFATGVTNQDELTVWDYNKPLTWNELLNNLFTYDRWMPEGKIDGEAVVFNTTKRIWFSEPYEIDFPCKMPTLFNKEVLVQTDNKLMALRNGYGKIAGRAHVERVKFQIDASGCKALIYPRWECV